MADVDVVSDILAATMAAFPASEFVQSLSHQYLVRGWLSKKQLQGLFDKASKVRDLPPGKLATLQAQIAKMPNRFKSEKPEVKPMFERDEAVNNHIDLILQKYPAHKRVLFLKTKFDNNELQHVEKAEIEKLFKLLIKA